ncbi:DUF281 domain-containing protein [Caenorhabditis elegans]|uniref:DUF281 domain-containing protein n=1 Tax=Caenorhabditis elegans TaxID=6239 RepID=Q22512_CAEEL|nr:DUF281 domain-containing protein [Caenorhabditis elegans]CCD62372.2 DUF281 domain-containing protein [Caenorhabditis elegans]|eukprot:NP_508647.2 Uncharacterized protein CELE_T14G12.6 [Caenorhabditis elegans]
MNTLTLFLTIPCFMAVTECCMRMVPPDDVYIPSTLAPGESTMAPVTVHTTIAAEETTQEMLTTPAMESSTVTEKYCAVSAAKCPDLASVVSANVVMTTDSDGCIELTCEIGDFPIAVAAFADSEIPPPTAAADELGILPPNSPEQIVLGLNAYYGLVCDNDKLRATEYPEVVINKISATKM